MTAPIPDKLFFTIKEAAEICAVEPHVLRYWEKMFPQLAPGKSETGQRVYRKHNLEQFLHVRRLLYDEGFTIAGARRQLEQAPTAVDRAAVQAIIDELRAIRALL
ncbi:MAG TPA: MerR family transcriptional regulator [bacterium]|nr:MerR family transcriptional regulator [bacterium]